MYIVCRLISKLFFVYVPLVGFYDRLDVHSQKNQTLAQLSQRETWTDHVSILAQSRPSLTLTLQFCCYYRPVNLLEGRSNRKVYVAAFCSMATTILSLILNATIFHGSNPWTQGLCLLITNAMYPIAGIVL